MLDFGALPPEINSARIYSGPGSGPMMAAASAWDALAAQLERYAAGYSATLSELRGQWSGGSSTAMAGAAERYVAWATTTAGLAEQAAGQARAAAAAFEVAFAATVPPAMIAANRTELAVLVATNFVGQNTPAIAATEAAYAEMWAQDAAAMYAYAAASAAATSLTPFTQPSQTTNAGGRAAQAAAVAHSAGSSPAGQTQAMLSELMSVVPHQLRSLAPGTSVDAASILMAFNDFNTLTGPLNPAWQTTYAVFSAGQYGTGLHLTELQAAKAAASAAGPGAAPGHPPAVADLGQAARVGKLSVPRSWAAPDAGAGPGNGATPIRETRPAAQPAASANAPANALGALPTAGTQRRPVGSVVLRNGRRVFKMPRPVAGG